jgi:hypothetical protein
MPVRFINRCGIVGWYAFSKMKEWEQTVLNIGIKPG